MTFIHQRTTGLSVAGGGEGPSLEDGPCLRSVTRPELVPHSILPPSIEEVGPGNLTQPEIEAANISKDKL